MNISDQGLWSELGDSLIGRFAARLLAAFAAAASGSLVIARATHARDAWHRFTPPMRWQFIGTVLLVSALTHLGLLALQRPSGWWWWAVPAIAVGVAVMLLALAIQAKRTSVSD